jgi:hypothetical protein
MLELDHILKINQWWVKRENLVRQAIIELGHILKTRKNCFRYLKLLPLMRPSVQQPISKDKNVMARARKYYLKNNYLTLRSKVKVPRRSLWYVTHRLMVVHPHTKYHWPISKDKNVMARTRKYYLKNNYLTLRSKIKVPRRSLWYATHRLMVMHPHTKYNWPIWKDKNVMVQTSFAEKKQKKRKKKIRLKQCLPSFEGET